MKRLIKDTTVDTLSMQYKYLLEDHPRAESQHTNIGLSKSLESISHSVNKSNWDEAEEATRIILDKLEDIRSSDIWPIFEDLTPCIDGGWVGVPFERDEIWDINFDEEEGVGDDSGGQDTVLEDSEREIPWIGTEIRYVRL